MQLPAADPHATPTFLRLLRDDRIKTVLVAGCGGGFDFMHSGHFLPMLLSWNKQIIFHSYSFGDPTAIRGGQQISSGKYASPEIQRRVPPMLGGDWPAVCLVDGSCVPQPNYGPEVALCCFLDQRYLGRGPKRISASEGAAAAAAAANDASGNADKGGQWWLYASYARHWTAQALRHFYHTLALVHDIDAILLIDGGSDSLMKGSESGLGDPIEDATSVAAVASLPDKILPLASADSTIPKQVDFVPLRLLVALGFGCDRFNTVEDRDGFAAIAELTTLTRPPANGIEMDHCGRDHSCGHADPEQHPHAMAGFLGVLAIERFSPAAQFYSALIDYTQDRFPFRSVIANSIVETTRGAFGDTVVPPTLRGRVRPGELDLWPLMSVAFAFDARLMLQRSLLCPRLLNCKTVDEMYWALKKMRQEVHK